MSIIQSLLVLSIIYLSYTEYAFNKSNLNSMRLRQTVHTCAAREYTGERVLVLIDHCVPGPQNEETIA